MNQYISPIVSIVFFISSWLLPMVGYCQDYESNFSREIDYIFENIDREINSDEYLDIKERANDFLDEIEDNEQAYPQIYLKRAEWIAQFSEIMLNEQSHIDIDGIDFISKHISFTKIRLKENDCFKLQLWKIENSVIMLTAVSKIDDNDESVTSIISFKVKYAYKPKSYTIARGGIDENEAYILKTFDIKYENELEILDVSCTDIYTYEY